LEIVFPINYDAPGNDAKMIVLTLDLPITGNEVSPFTDVAAIDGGDPFYPVSYVAVCAAYGITQGTTPISFSPYQSITRQQLISMVARAGKLVSPPADFAVSFSRGQFYLEDQYLDARQVAYAGLLEGLQEFDAACDFTASASRGECAQILWNLLPHN
jgi:hypothetical protein